MAIEVITIADIDVDLFTQFSGAPDKQQKVVDYANADIVDIASQYGIVEADIATPYHEKLKDHAINVAVYQFMIKRMRFNNSTNDLDAYGAMASVYKSLKQESRAEITKVMFTGEEQNSTSRAVDGVRLELG
jgi:hypothetical protein